MSPRIAVAALACAALQACAGADGPAPAQPPISAFMPMAEFRVLAEAAPWRCFGYDPATRTCGWLEHTSWRDDRNGVTKVVLLVTGAPRITFVMSTQVWFERDKRCGRYAESAVELVADVPVPPDAAEEAEAALRGKLAESKGVVTCVGLVREGDRFREVAYLDGEPMDRTATFSLSAEPPALRVWEAMAQDHEA